MVDVLFLVEKAGVQGLGGNQHGGDQHDGADDQADNQLGAQAVAQQGRSSQGVGRGGDVGLGNHVADDQSGGDISHGLIDLLGHSDADGDQDDEGDVEEHGDRQQEAGTGQCPGNILGGHCVNQGDCDFLRHAGIAHQLTQDHAQADGKTDTGHHAAESGSNGVQGGHDSQPAGNTHIGAGDDQAHHGVQLGDQDQTNDDDD